MNLIFKKTSALCLLIASSNLFSGCSVQPNKQLNEKEALGKLLFFDETLSEPTGQSCATCHTKETGFADKYSRITSEGAVKGLFSNRNSMTIAYTAYVPPLYYNEDDETYIGGLFWDGRVNTLQEQAAQPFINKLEMGNLNHEMVINKVKQTAYYPELIRLYGKTTATDSLFNYIADAIAAYEMSWEVSPFSSKFDAYLAGDYKLSKEEKEGLYLFENEGLCKECHILDKDPRARRTLLTDHTYDNLGIPANPENPFFTIPAEFNPLGKDTTDLGLGGILKIEAENGKFRVPTLRNIELTAPYGHNGYFKTLEEIVHFYNVRDVSSVFPSAEYPATVNKEELGNLQLSAKEEQHLIAFMKTLTDGYIK